MLLLLQRVGQAAVEVDGRIIAEIGPGLLVFAGFGRDDTDGDLPRAAERLVAYRVFADPAGKMNLDVRQSGGEILIVPQFTLLADTARGLRPSFTPAAEPAAGERLFTAFVAHVGRLWPATACGRFGATMQVKLINDGPATFILRG